MRYLLHVTPVDTELRKQMLAVLETNKSRSLENFSYAAPKKTDDFLSRLAGMFTGTLSTQHNSYYVARGCLYADW